MRLFCSLLAAAAALATQSAAAHGPQIQITGETGKITTRRLLLDGPYSSTLTAETSVYVMPLKEHLGVWYSRPNGDVNPVTHAPTFYSGPGIAYGYGYDSANPTDVDFAPGSVMALEFTAGLKRWDGSAFADAGVTEIESFRGSFVSPTATARTSDSGPFASLTFAPVDFTAEGAEVHSTSRFRLLGDGSSPAAASPDGVYLLSLRLTNTRMAASKPFYFVLSKNSNAATVGAAIASLNVAPSQVQYVPEPGAAGMAVVGIALTFLGARRRRQYEGTKQ